MSEQQQPTEQATRRPTRGSWWWGRTGWPSRPPPGNDEVDERSVTDLVDQPAKVMRIGSMIKQLLEEVRAAPSWTRRAGPRLKEIHTRSIKELEEGLAPELVEELERISLPFTDDTVPSRVRAAGRPGPAGRLAGGAVPRHPDRAVRPADGGPRAVRGDAPSRPAARPDGSRRPRAAPASTPTAPPPTPASTSSPPPHDREGNRQSCSVDSPHDHGGPTACGQHERGRGLTGRLSWMPPELLVRRPGDTRRARGARAQAPHGAGPHQARGYGSSRCPRSCAAPTAN